LAGILTTDPASAGRIKTQNVTQIPPALDNSRLNSR
jgi:hypothetical protein